MWFWLMLAYIYSRVVDIEESFDCSYINVIYITAKYGLRSGIRCLSISKDESLNNCVPQNIRRNKGLFFRLKTVFRFYIFNFILDHILKGTSYYELLQQKIHELLYFVWIQAPFLIGRGSKWVFFRFLAKDTF